MEVGAPLASLTYRTAGRLGSACRLFPTECPGAGANVSPGAFGKSGAPRRPTRNRIAVDSAAKLGL